MPHESFGPPSPAGQGESDCTITPPEDCNGHGTRDLEACDCDCDEGYKTDFENLLDVRWCVEAEEEENGRDKDLGGGEVVNGTTTTSGGVPAGGVVFGTTPGIVIFVVVVVAIISLCVWWRWCTVRRKRGQPACCCSCWWLTCCLDCCGLICCTQRERKEKDRRGKRPRRSHAQNRSHAFLEERPSWESRSHDSSTVDQHASYRWKTGHGSSHKKGGHGSQAGVKRHQGVADASHLMGVTTALGPMPQTRGGAHEHGYLPHDTGVAGVGIRSNLPPPLMYPSPVLTSDPWAQAQAPVHPAYHPLMHSYGTYNAPRHPHHTRSPKPPPVHGPLYPHKAVQPFQQQLPYTLQPFPHVSTDLPLGPRGSYAKFSPSSFRHPPGIPHSGHSHWPHMLPFSSNQAGQLSINNPMFEMGPGMRDMQGSSGPFNRLQDGYVSVCMPRRSEERWSESEGRSPHVLPYQRSHTQDPGYDARGSSRHNRRANDYGRHRHEGRQR